MHKSDEKKSGSEEEIEWVSCPQCGRQVIWSPQSPFRPFCSKVCQLIDFGEWAEEEKRIPSSQSLMGDEEEQTEPTCH